MKYFILYLVIINIIALIITVHDKSSAQKGSWRVKERTLMLVSALGGAPVMYITMLTINHKTRKPLFMIGIPLIFISELIAAYLAVHYGFGLL